ncbi:hypothetical protein BV25DRAFT_1795005 [Artomyces pyxidatus]|uniref:Uncharacterized protein n=1 Tax=Artomyces pyxidatus TaxID=48021 RepID=A0ACB8TFJ4_9AGAM|nr:hypothetical protein BV25DRAFT_1795005 [Artomyces pyxidatus]
MTGALPWPSIDLTFERDNPYNTTLIDESKRTRYVVSTDFSPPFRTRVIDGAGTLVAEWAWRDTRPDPALNMRGRRTVPVSRWLKKSMLPFKRTVTFKDDTGLEYKWEANASGVPLKLFGPYSKTEPVARYLRARKELDGPDQPAQLFVDQCTEDVRDLIVVSFLLLERLRLWKQTKASKRSSLNGSIVGVLDVA